MGNLLKAHPTISLLKQKSTNLTVDLVLVPRENQISAQVVGNGIKKFKLRLKTKFMLRRRPNKMLSLLRLPKYLLILMQKMVKMVKMQKTNKLKRTSSHWKNF